MDEAFVKRNDLVFVQTLCQDKDEYLTRPDRGRRFDEENQAVIRKTLGAEPKVALVVGTASPPRPSRPMPRTVCRPSAGPEGLRH